MDSEVTKEKIHTEPMLNDPRYITLLSLVVLFFTLCKLYFKNVLMRFTFVFHEITYVLLLLFSVFFWFYSRRRHVRQSVLFTGLSDAGKTLLFVRLAYSQYRQTFTSMKENVEEYVTSKVKNK